MEERELPVGWVDAPLLGLGELIRGVTYSKNDSSDRSFSGSIPILRANNIQDRHFDTANLVHVPTSLVAQTQIVKAGDVVIATSSGSISVVGKAAQAREDFAMAFGAFCGLIRPSNEISPEYFGHFFSSEYYRTAVSDMARGVNINNLKKSHFESLNIPLPPLNEQRRIAAKLDSTLAAVDACRQRLDGVAAILKRFRQAVLAAATSGELTREWREDNPDEVDASSLAAFLASSHSLAGGHKRGNAAPPTNGVHDLDEKQFPEGWSLVELRDIVRPDKPITYGILKPGPEILAGIPYIRVADYPGDRLCVDGIRKTSFEIDEAYKRSRLEVGDLLLSIRGTVGRLVTIPPELEGANITQDSARLSIQEVLSASYIKYSLHSELLQSRMQRAVKGVAVRGINIGDVRALQVPLPSIQEQEEISRQVESLLSLADQLEERLTSARKIVNRLTSALLAKAFRGELVPQDPTDEPASVLLDRIRAARQAEAGAGKPLRRGRPKAAANPDQLPLDAAPVPPDFLAGLLRECGPLSERALLAVSELEPQRFQQQLYRELESGTAREVQADGQLLLEAVG